jgi:hypothetical protein
MILRITKVDRSKAKKSANRGAVASSPLLRSPAREWSDAVKQEKIINNFYEKKKTFSHCYTVCIYNFSEQKVHVISFI